jgi:tetratricopeptide (TPR) repeat protein
MSTSSAADALSVVQSSTTRGWQLYRAGQLAAALAMFNITLGTAPDDYSALLGRGRCHRLLGTYAEAIVDFTHAHEVRPCAARPLFERGAISILIGRYEESLINYEAAARLEPSYPGSASYFAELCLYTGRPDEALAISEQASRDEPGNIMNRLNIAHAHLLLGNVERALDSYTAIAEVRDPARRMTGAAIALHDLALMRGAGIEAPGMLAVERRLRTFERDEAP